MAARATQQPGGGTDRHTARTGVRFARRGGLTTHDVPPPASRVVGARWTKNMLVESGTGSYSMSVCQVCPPPILGRFPAPLPTRFPTTSTAGLAAPAGQRMAPGKARFVRE